MQVSRVRALIISLVAQVTVTCVSSQSTFMYFKLESTGVNYRYVRFYNDTFQTLYNCMRQVHTTQCLVQTVRQSSLPPASLPQGYDGNDFKALYVVIIQGSLSDRGYFTCQFDQSVSVLECTKSTTSQCEGDMCTSFRRRSSTSTCDTDCVYLLWLYEGETLVFYEKTDKFDNCQLVCAQTTNALLPSSQPSDASTLRPEPPLDATANSSKVPTVTETITSGDSSGNVGLIIGVVCGVLCLVILVIVIGFIYRRRKQTKRPSANNGVSSSRTDTNYDEIAVQHSNTKISNVSNIPDVLSTLPQSDLSIEKNGESEDGYYTIDNACELNKYENALKSVPSKTTTINDDENAQEFYNFQNEPTFSPPIFQVHGEGDVNSEPSCTREGDYFILESENNDVKDSEIDTEHKNMGCGYSLAKDVSQIDVSTIDVIDVSSPSKNAYSKFGNNATDKINPYDMLLQPQGIHKPRPN
ncbi:hypothetical protein BsWGS_25362 [Bradybaena similaris]